VWCGVVWCGYASAAMQAGNPAARQGACNRRRQPPLTQLRQQQATHAAAAPTCGHTCGSRALIHTQLLASGFLALQTSRRNAQGASSMGGDVENNQLVEAFWSIRCRHRGSWPCISKATQWQRGMREVESSHAAAPGSGVPGPAPAKEVHKGQAAWRWQCRGVRASGLLALH